MTVSTYLSEVRYIGNGLAREFAVPFKFLQNADLTVETTIGQQTTRLVLGQGYTVTGAGDEAGGTVTLTAALVADATLAIRRDFPFTQNADLPNAGAFHAQTHEDALDRITMMCQQLQRNVTADAWPLWPPGTNGTLPNPRGEWMLAWNRQGDALENINPFELGAPIEPIGGADAVWLNGWSEFAYATLPVLDDGQQPMNAVLDRLVRLRPAVQWEADFLHVLRDDLPRTKARRVMLWYQWFTYTDNLGSLWPMLSYPTSLYLWADPDLFTVDLTARGGPRYNLDGSDGGTAAIVGPNITQPPGGTVADVALVQGIRELAARGYEVGISPLAIFYDPTKFWSGDYFIWRGLATWPDLATFNAWLVDYRLMHRHCMDILAWASCKPWLVYVGSEMRWLSAEAPADIMSAWYLCLQDLADEWRAAFPGVEISYSASDYEAGYFQGEYPMDALWSHPSVDYIGFSWYKPLAVKHTNDYGVLRAGVLSGERIDYYTDYGSMEPGRWLSGSDGQGKTSVPLYAMESRTSWQNGAVAWQRAHYADKRAGVVAGTSPLVGHNAGMRDDQGATAIFADLAGTAIRAHAAGVKVDVGPGMLPPPPETDYFLRCDGTTYASTAFPATINYPVTSYRVSLVFQHVSAQATVGNALFVRNADTNTVCGIEVDRTNPNAVTIAFRHRDTALADHVQVFATVDEAAPTVTTVDIEVTAATLTINGTEYALATPPLMPTAGAALWFGTLDGALGFEQCDLYFASFEGLSATPNRKIGGQWFFEDDYAGVRSAFVPESKPPIAAEIGFASITGSCVEPNVFPETRLGAGVLPAPEWFTDHAYWSDKGVEDLHGPTGSTFNADEFHQAICLSAAVRALKEAGFVHLIAYNLDARPGAAMDARNWDGSFYFGDGPKQRLTHALNGKLAGGTINEEVSYLVTPAPPVALTTTGISKVWFVRHADTATDPQTGFYIRDFTATGDQQVADLPAKLAGFGAAPDIVICSPEWRAVNTIRAWLEAQGMQAELWPELTESSWNPTGLETVKIHGGLAIQQFLEHAFRLRERGHGTINPDIPYPCRVYGESPDAGLFLVLFANNLIRSRFSGKGVEVLVIGHYHTGARLLDELQGISSATYDPNAPPYQLSNAKVNMLTEDGANYRLDIFNDVVRYSGSLMGANWVHIGDSISTDRFWVGWPDGTRGGDLETRMRWTLIKNASRGGRTVHDGTFNGTWLWCLQDVLTLDFANVDIVTLLVGTNDWGGGLGLGLFTDPASKDTYSFYANYRYVIEWLYTKKPTLKIVCMTPLQRTYAGMLGSLPHPTGGATLLQFVDAIKALQVDYAGQGYDIHVIDLYNGNVLTEATEPDGGPYTYTYDGLHPDWDTPGETDCITNPVQSWFEVNFP